VHFVFINAEEANPERTAQTDSLKEYATHKLYPLTNIAFPTTALSRGQATALGSNETPCYSTSHPDLSCLIHRNYICQKRGVC